MRDASNDAYKSRDRYLYLNIGLRVFSVLQVAYLQGLLGGGEPGNGLQVAGHDVQCHRPAHRIPERPGGRLGIVLNSSPWTRVRLRGMSLRSPGSVTGGRFWQV